MLAGLFLLVFGERVAGFYFEAAACNQDVQFYTDQADGLAATRLVHGRIL